MNMKLESTLNLLTLCVYRAFPLFPLPGHEAHLGPENKAIMQKRHCCACGGESSPKEPSESKLILNAPLSGAYIHGNYE